MVDQESSGTSNTSASEAAVVLLRKRDWNGSKILTTDIIEEKMAECLAVLSQKTNESIHAVEDSVPAAIDRLHCAQAVLLTKTVEAAKIAAESKVAAVGRKLDRAERAAIEIIQEEKETSLRDIRIEILAIGKETARALQEVRSEIAKINADTDKAIQRVLEHIEKLKEARRYRRKNKLFDAKPKTPEQLQQELDTDAYLRSIGIEPG